VTDGQWLLHATALDFDRPSVRPFARQGKGSHEVWFSPITKRTFSVAVTINSRHTANEVLKQAGIDKRF
jgi:hypothetical protein